MFEVEIGLIRKVRSHKIKMMVTVPHFLVFLLSLLFGGTAVLAEPVGAVRAKVLEVFPEERAYRVLLVGSELEAFEAGEVRRFRVGLGDSTIDYTDRTIEAEAAYYGEAWHLEKIFPLNGPGAKAARDVNRRFQNETATTSRRSMLRTGDYIPNFALINQDGAFIQARGLRGDAFVMNFIFTRCTIPNMCPASTERMAKLQEVAPEVGLEDLHYVTVSFDPEFDSPGILKQYAEGYGIDTGNFQLMTGAPETIEAILKRFGILTREEDGTINHTMATFLIDPNGRIAFRKEGSSWTVDAFVDAALAL